MDKRIEVCKGQKKANEFMKGRNITDVKALSAIEDEKAQFYFIVLYSVN